MNTHVWRALKNAIFSPQVKGCASVSCHHPSSEHVGGRGAVDRGCGDLSLSLPCARRGKADNFISPRMRPCGKEWTRGRLLMGRWGSRTQRRELNSLEWTSSPWTEGGPLGSKPRADTYSHVTRSGLSGLQRLPQLYLLRLEGMGRD